MSYRFTALVASIGYVNPDDAPVQTFTEADLEKIENLIIRTSDYQVESKVLEDGDQCMRFVLYQPDPVLELIAQERAEIDRFVEIGTDLRPQIVKSGLDVDEILDRYAREHELLTTYSYSIEDQD